MTCLKPIRLNYSKDEIVARQNDPLLDSFAKSQTYHLVPCGKCEFCLSKKRSDWFFRLRNEFDYSDSAFFFTLTYDDSKLPINDKGFYSVCKRDIQLFLKRFRKRIQPFKIRYYIVSEYGPRSLRPHYHGIIFNFPQSLRRKLDNFLLQSWDKGFVSISDVNDSRINYVTYYCLFSKENPPGTCKNFMLCSRRPLIGAGFVQRFIDLDYFNDNLTDIYAMRSTSGDVQKFRIPRIYREKLLSDDSIKQINAKYDKRNYEKFTDLYTRQYEWLISHGFDPLLKTPIEGSPLWEYLQSKESKRIEFKNKFTKRTKRI